MSEVIQIKGGRRFSLAHAPSTEEATLSASKTVGVTPRGFHGLKPRVVVAVGDKVTRGQELFHDKKRPQVKWTSPAGGTIEEIRYGKRRSLQAVVISVGDDESHSFDKHDRGALAGLGQEKVVKTLAESGLWNRFVAFPGWAVAPMPGEVLPEPVSEHDEVPVPKSLKAVYISALATEPHQVDPMVALKGNEETFAAGLEVVRQAAPKAYLISASGQKLPAQASSVTGVNHRQVNAVYPAENTGLQSYYVDKPAADEVVAGLSVEDVIDIGHLFLNGSLRTERTYALAGDGAQKKTHVKARPGISVADLTQVSEENLGDTRVIAGGIFTGNKVGLGDYLSPAERCVQLMKEDRERTPFHFQFRLGAKYLTVFRTWLAGFKPVVAGEATTSLHGEERACVQCGKCIDVCPVGLMPNLVFKAALQQDIEKMESVFINDCVDCGLCTFVCPSKIELGEHIESGKALIEKEG